MNPTTEFDHLMKQAFQILFPSGSNFNYFKARLNDNCYQKAVKPDYVIPGEAWIDFKLKVSYRESKDYAWRPSALYTSIRKYIDHVDNLTKRLTIVYGRLYGSIDDVIFPISRGRQILIQDEIQFKNKINLVPTFDIIKKLQKTQYQWIIDRIYNLL